MTTANWQNAAKKAPSEPILVMEVESANATVVRQHLASDWNAGTINNLDVFDLPGGGAGLRPKLYTYICDLDWNNAATYPQHTYVRQGGITYRALVGVPPGQAPPNAQYTIDSITYPYWQTTNGVSMGGITWINWWQYPDWYTPRGGQLPRFLAPVAGYLESCTSYFNARYDQSYGDWSGTALTNKHLGKTVSWSAWDTGSIGEFKDGRHCNLIRTTAVQTAILDPDHSDPTHPDTHIPYHSGEAVPYNVDKAYPSGGLFGTTAIITSEGGSSSQHGYSANYPNADANFAITYRAASGTITTKVFDLGATPVQDSVLTIKDIATSGATIVYTLSGSDNNSTWTSLGAVTDGDTVNPYRYYRFQITFTCAVKNNVLYVPELYEIRIAGGDSQYEYYATHRNQPVISGYEVRPYLKSVNGISSSISLKDKPTVGDISIVLQYLKETSNLVIATNRKRSVKVWLGFKGLAFADYAPYFTGIWDSFTPDQDKREITIKVRDVFKQFKKKIPEMSSSEGKAVMSDYIIGPAANIIDAILSIASTTGIPSRFLDKTGAASLRDSIYTGDTWNVSRTFTQQEESDDLLKELTTTAGVFPVPGHDGKLRLTHYDTIATKSAAELITLDAGLCQFSAPEADISETITRIFAYHHQIEGTDGTKGDDFNNLFWWKDGIPAEIDRDEVVLYEWFDKWNTSSGAATGDPTPLTRLADRLGSWFCPTMTVDGRVVARANYTVTASKIPLRYFDIMPGDAILVNNLRVPAPSAEWEGFTDNTRFLVLSKKMDTRDWTISLDLFQISAVNYNNAPSWYRYETQTIIDTSAPAVLFAPFSLSATEIMRETNYGATLAVDVILTWSYPLTAISYTINWIGSDGITHTIDNVTGTTYTLRDLAAGHYAFQVMAGTLTGTVSSPWASVEIEVSGIKTTVPDVTGLELFGQGNNTDFIGKDAKFRWNKINPYLTDSADIIAGVNKPQAWFRYYELEIYNSSNILRRTEYLLNETYNYDHEKNHVDGAGTPARTLKVRLRAVSVWGDVSKNPASLTITNPAPPAVGTVTLTAFFNSVSIAWEPVTDIDMLGYVVHLSTAPGFTPDASTLVNRGPETSVFITDLEGSTVYIRVAGFDVFGEDGLNYSNQYSIVIPTLGALDLVAPATPAGLTLAAGIENLSQTSTAYIVASWTLSTETDFDSYVLQLRRGTETDYIEVSVVQPTVSYKFTGLIPGVAYSARIAGVDKWGNYSAFTSWTADSTAADSTPPAVPTTLTLASSFTNVFASWIAVSDADLKHYEIQTATDAGFTANVRVFTTTANLISFSATASTTYYVRVRAVDYSTNASAYTSTSSTTTGTAAITGIDDFAITASKLYTKIPVLEGDSWTNNSPSAGYIAWGAHQLYYNGAKYEIGAGNTNLRYVYFDGTTTYAKSDTSPSLTDAQFIIATNAKDAAGDATGIHDLAWNAIANEVIGTAHIINAAISTAKIADLAVDNAKIAALAVDNAKIANATIQSGKIVSLVADKITTGTLSATTTITVGGKVTLAGTTDHASAATGVITVADGIRDRVKTGYLGYYNSKDHYGLVVVDAAGLEVLKIDQDGALLQNLTAGSINANVITISNLVVGTNVTMGSSATISWANVTSPPTIPTNTNQLTDGAGLGATAAWSGVSSRPGSLSDLDSTASTKLGGIAAGATVGATWGVNITNQPTIPTVPSYITSTKITGTSIESCTMSANTFRTSTADSGKRIILDSTNNEAYFYGDRGDGTIQLISSIGGNAYNGNDTIGVYSKMTYGPKTTSYLWAQLAPIVGEYTGGREGGSGLYGVSPTKVGVAGRGAECGVYGINTGSGGSGVIGESSHDVGYGIFAALGVRGASIYSECLAPLRISPSTTAGFPTHQADKGAVWVDLDGEVYISIDSYSVNWARVATGNTTADLVYGRTGFLKNTKTYQHGTALPNPATVCNSDTETVVYATYRHTDGYPYLIKAGYVEAGTPAFHWMYVHSDGVTHVPDCPT